MIRDYKKGRLIPINYAALPGATLNANVANFGDYKIENVVDADADLVMEGSNNFRMNFTLDSPRLVDAVAICGHSMTETGNVRVIYYDESNQPIWDSGQQSTNEPLFGAFRSPGAFQMEAFGGASVEDPLIPRVPYTDVYSPNVELVSKVSVFLKDTSIDRIICSYVYIGQAWSAHWNFDYGSAVGFVPQINTVDQPHGATIGSHPHPKRQAALAFSFLSEDERTQIFDFVLLWQLYNHPVFWSGYPEHRNGTLAQQNRVLAFPINWSSPSPLNSQFSNFQLTLKEIYYYGVI